MATAAMLRDSNQQAPGSKSWCIDTNMSTSRVNSTTPAVLQLASLCCAGLGGQQRAAGLNNRLPFLLCSRLLTKPQASLITCCSLQGIIHSLSIRQGLGCV